MHGNKTDRALTALSNGECVKLDSEAEVLYVIENPHPKGDMVVHDGTALFRTEMDRIENHIATEDPEVIVMDNSPFP